MKYTSKILLIGAILGLGVSIAKANTLGIVNLKGVDMTIEVYKPEAYAKCFVPVYSAADTTGKYVLPAHQTAYFKEPQDDTCPDEILFAVLDNASLQSFAFLGYDSKSPIKDSIKYKLITKGTYLFVSEDAFEDGTILSVGS